MASYYSLPVPSFPLSFFLTIFTPLSIALLLRGGAARNTAGVGSDGDGTGDGGLGMRGNGVKDAAALTVGCGCE